MKTIKQIADEIGVSKQAVNKKIDNLGLRNSCRKIGNQIQIELSAENLIKQAFDKNKSTTESTTKSTTKCQLCDNLDALNDTLMMQCDAMEDEIKRLHNLLEREQQIRMTELQARLLTAPKKWQFWRNKNTE